MKDDQDARYNYFLSALNVTNSYRYKLWLLAGSAVHLHSLGRVHRLRMHDVSLAVGSIHVLLPSLAFKQAILHVGG